MTAPFKDERVCDSGGTRRQASSRGRGAPIALVSNSLQGARTAAALLRPGSRALVVPEGGRGLLVGEGLGDLVEDHLLAVADLERDAEDAAACGGDRLGSGEQFVTELGELGGAQGLLELVGEHVPRQAAVLAGAALDPGLDRGQGRALPW